MVMLGTPEKRAAIPGPPSLFILLCPTIQATSDIGVLVVSPRIDIGVLVEVVVQCFVIILIIVVEVIVIVIVINVVDVEIIIIIVVVIIVVIIVDVEIVIEVVVFIIERTRKTLVFRIFLDRFRQDEVQSETKVRANSVKRVEMLQQHVFRLHLSYTGLHGKLIGCLLAKSIPDTRKRREGATPRTTDQPATRSRFASRDIFFRSLALR